MCVEWRGGGWREKAGGRQGAGSCCLVALKVLTVSVADLDVRGRAEAAVGVARAAESRVGADGVANTEPPRGRIKVAVELVELRGKGREGSES